MTSNWDAMWAKPFDDGAHYATKHLMEDAPAPDPAPVTAAELFLDGKVMLHCGDMLTVLPTLAENSVDSCVTDPPYHLTSIVQRFANANPETERFAANNDHKGFRRLSAGFMGQKWDGGDVAFQPETWREVWRVLKPGAHLLAFGGTRTYHRMACAIEDAGFEIRDCIMWVYGSGFPKSHNAAVGIAKQIDPDWQTGDPLPESAAAWEGWGTALKPACEPIVVARKPLKVTVAANVLRWGTGALNIDGCRVVGDPGDGHWTHKREIGGKGIYGGGGRQELDNGNVGHALGRWPANLVHDGSDEVVAAFPQTTTGNLNLANITAENQIFGKRPKVLQGYHEGDSGSAARFFYTAKADQDERLGSKHPTIKPVDLMQWLIRLVTPRGGVILDPFAGTGTTGEAAWCEGMRAVLIEREAEYQDCIRRRMALALAGPDERSRETIKAAGRAQGHDDLPLFGGA